MGRPRVVVEFETCSRDLPHGGVFVPGLKLAELAECELVVRIPGRELALVARAVMVTPAGCGLELVGFGNEIRTKLADLATAALAVTRAKSTPPSVPTPRPAAAAPSPSPSSSSPRIPTPPHVPQTVTKPAPLPGTRPTTASTPPPPPPRSRPTTPPPAPQPPPSRPPPGEDDEPEMTIERDDDEPEMTIERGDEPSSGKRDPRLQTAPMAVPPTPDEPNFAEVPDEPEAGAELTTKPAAALDNAEDDDANFARIFDEPGAATPAKTDEPNFAEVPDEPPQDDGPTVTASPDDLDDEPAMITEQPRHEDTAVTRLTAHRTEDTAITRHEATAITPAPTNPDGEHEDEEESRHEPTAITTRPLDPDDHPLDPDEPTIMPSTFEPMALETGYRPPPRALKPEPSIPVSHYETNRWGHVDLDDNMPRVEIRDDKASLSLDAEPPDELLELADAPAAAAAAAAAEPTTSETAAAPASPDEPKPEDKPAADAAAPAAEGTADGEDDVLAGATEEERKLAKNVHERLRGLNLAQQIKMAHQGETHERIVLERMYGKTVWEALLRNPRITGPEVARIARMGQLPRPLIEIIVGNGGWLQIPEVRRALLTNPRLGTDQILRVLRLLPKHELKLAGVQTSYPSPVRDAARKLVKELQR